MGILSRWLTRPTPAPRTGRRLDVEALEPRSTPAALASPGTPVGTNADGDTSDELLAVSADGNVVLFASKATNLVTGATDNNSDFDLFWRDLATGTTKLVTAQAGTLNALGFGSGATVMQLAGRAALSRDGQRVAFVSAAPAATVVGNPALQDQLTTNDVFWWRADTGAAKLVSVRNTGTSAVGNTAGVDSLDPILSEDGTFVGYGSNLDAGLIDSSKAIDNLNVTYDLFRRDMSLANELTATTTVTRVGGTADAIGRYGVANRPVGTYMSGDGRFFTFATSVSAFTILGVDDAADTDDVYVRDMTVDTAGGLALASVSLAGKAIGVTAGVLAQSPVISRGGTTVLFISTAPGGTDDKNLVSGFTTGGAPAELYARINPFAQSRSTKLVSGVNGSTNAGANGFVQFPTTVGGAASYQLIGDGSAAVFVSAGTNLVDAAKDRNGSGLDVFLRTLSTNTTEVVSVAKDGRTGTAPSDRPGVTDDGKMVVFVSASPELAVTVTDTNAAADVFLRDRTAGTTRTVSTTISGATTGDAGATAGQIGANGTAVVFVSKAKNLGLNALPTAVANLYAATLPLAPVLGGGSKTLAVSGTGDGKILTYSADVTGKLNAVGQAITPFTVQTPSRVASADVNGDNVADVIAVVGPGGGSLLRVIDGQTGNDIVAPVSTYEATFTGGLFVATADLDRDGRAEIILSPDVGGGGRVQVFSVSGTGLQLRANFFGIDDTNFRGGARVAAGDVNGDGRPDVVIGAGFGGGPRVAVFNGAQLLDPASAAAVPPKLFGDFFAFPGDDSTRLRNGVFVSAGDVNGDGSADLVFGGGPGGGPRVYVLNGATLTKGLLDLAYSQPLANFFAFDDTQRGGVRVSVKDLDGDALQDIVVGSGEKTASSVKTYLSKSLPVGGTGAPTVQQSIDPFSSTSLTAGVFVG